MVRGRAIDPAVNKVAKTLADNGYAVKLLVWDRQHNLDAGGDGYAVHTFRLKAPYDKATVLFYLPIWWLYELFFLLRDRCDVIHACDLDTLLPAAFAKLVRRIPLCYTIYDAYADNLPDGRFGAARAVIRRFVAWVERTGVGLADALFLVHESQYEDLRGARIKSLAYIHNTPPDYLDPERSYQRSGLTKTTIFYAGSLHRSRGLESMLEAVKGLEGVRLLIAGLCTESSLSAHLTGNQSEGALTALEYLGWVPYEEVIRNTLMADVLFAFHDPGVRRFIGASPNKLFEAMMSGKPIIVSDGTWAANVVREEECGLVVPYGDTEAVRNAVLMLRDDPALRQALGQNGRRAYEQRYSWRIMEQRLLHAYRKLGNKAGESHHTGNGHDL